MTIVEPPTKEQGARRVWSDSGDRIWVAEWMSGDLSLELHAGRSGSSAPLQIAEISNVRDLICSRDTSIRISICEHLGSFGENAVPQVTLYLDDETKTLMRERAKAAGLSNSKWIALLIRKQAQDEWPASVKSLAGRFADLPLAEDARSIAGKDVERIGF